MKITGKLIERSKREIGTTKDGRNWFKINIVVETDDKYNNIYPIEVFEMDSMGKGSNIARLQGKQLGEYKADFEFNVSARKYNDKWYTSLTLWKMSDFQYLDTGRSKPTPTETQEQETGGDLPF